MGKRNDLKQIIREIKRTYRRYTEEIKGGKVSIKDVISFFDIPLDETRLEDLHIESIDFQKPSIVVVDNKTNTVYKATYYYDAERSNLDDYHRNNVFVTATNGLCETESLYRIPFNKDEDRHLATSIILKKDDLELIFTRHGSLRVDTRDERFLPGFSIRYVKNSEGKSRKKQNLLVKIYKKFGKYPRTKAYNLMYNFDDNSPLNHNDEQATYVIMNSDNVEYYINNMAIKDETGQIGLFLVGFCLDNLESYGHEKRPFPSYADKLNKMNCPDLFDPKTSAAIYLKGGVPKEMWGELKIFKRVDQIYIKYNVKTKISDNDKDEFKNTRHKSFDSFARDALDLLLKRLVKTTDF